MASFVHQLLILHRPQPVPLAENGPVLHPGALATKWLGCVLGVGTLELSAFLDTSGTRVVAA